MADTPKLFRADAKARESEGIENLQGLKWTDVHDELEKERTAKRRYELGCQRTPPSQTMTDTIKNACDRLLLDFENMEFCIGFYSDRNKACHSMVSDKVARCDWEALGRQLCLDREEMTSVFNGEQLRQMTEALDRVAKRYFEKQRRPINRLVAAERTEKKEKELASLARKKNRVRRQLEKEKSSKKAARASRDSTENWTEVNDDLGFGDSGRYNTLGILLRIELLTERAVCTYSLL
ncbi:MAG: hypothetical protein Q9178_004697 [Gyalolechia marmorata]